MTGVDLTRIDGVDGFTALKVISEIWHGNNEVGERRPLRFLVGTEPGQSGNRWQGNQLKDEAHRQPSRGSIALGHHALHRSDSALGAFLRRKKAHLGAPQAITATARKLAHIIYSIIPCCGTARITWMLAPNTTRASISSGRCARQNGGRPNWATS